MSLAGRVAVVAGATRGAGRGIACMLGAAGAMVYLAAEYGFTDVDGRTPHFWRGVDERLGALARSDAALEPSMRGLMQHRYRMIHREWARRDEAQRFAARLGLELGAGLRPVRG